MLIKIYHATELANIQVDKSHHSMTFATSPKLKATYNPNHNSERQKNKTINSYICYWKAQKRDIFFIIPQKLNQTDLTGQPKVFLPEPFSVYLTDFWLLITKIMCNLTYHISFYKNLVFTQWQCTLFRACWLSYFDLF